MMFTTLDTALAALPRIKLPSVIRGSDRTGIVIVQTYDDARLALQDAFDNGDSVVVEELIEHRPQRGDRG